MVNDMKKTDLPRFSGTTDPKTDGTVPWDNWIDKVRYFIASIDPENENVWKTTDVLMRSNADLEDNTLWHSDEEKKIKKALIKAAPTVFNSLTSTSELVARNAKPDVEPSLLPKLRALFKQFGTHQQLSQVHYKDVFNQDVYNPDGMETYMQFCVRKESMPAEECLSVF